MTQEELLKKWQATLGSNYARDSKIVPLIGGANTFKAMYRAITTASDENHFIYLLAWWLDDRVALHPSNFTLPKAKGDPLEFSPWNSLQIDEIGVPEIGTASTSIRNLFSERGHIVQIRAMLWRQVWQEIPFRPNAEQIDKLLAAGVSPTRLQQLSLDWRSVSPPDTPEQIKHLLEIGVTVEQIRELSFTPNPRNRYWHHLVARRINALPNGGAIVDDLFPCATGSHHQKVLIVNGAEGLIAFCGGIDINADRVRVVNPNKGEPLRVVHCEIRGPAAAHLLKVFVGRWNLHPGHTSVDARKGTLRGVRVSAPSKSGAACVRTVQTLNRVTGSELNWKLRRSSCQLDRSMRDSLLAAIKAAERFIYIEDQYLVSPRVAKALRKAVRRATMNHVIALVPNSDICDLPQVWRRRKKFIDLVGDPAGEKFRVYYRVDPDGRYGAGSYVHSKTWVIDDEIALIGSANVNNRGLSSDSEVGVWLVDNARSEVVQTPPSTAQRLRMDLWARHLKLPADTFRDAVNSRDQWDLRGSEGLVRRYDPTAGEDSAWVNVPGVWSLLADPRVDNTPFCKK